MTLELCVYVPEAGEPAVADISELLGLAGWRWAAVADGPRPRPAERLHRARALGWEASDGVGGAVESALAAGAAEALAELTGTTATGTRSSVVDIVEAQAAGCW